MPINFPNKPGIVAYLTAGDPSLEITRDIALAAIDNGADVIELGVPFSDPLADGPVIQRASERASSQRHPPHRRPRHRQRPPRSKTRRRPGPLLLSKSRSPPRHGEILRRRSRSRRRRSPPHRHDRRRGRRVPESMRHHKLAPIFLAAPTSPDARLKAIAGASQGFVYAISRVGITGTQQRSPATPRSSSRAQPVHRALPIAVGFGISTPSMSDRR